MTTEEDRIRAHYRGLKKRLDPSTGDLGVDVFMRLARQWKRPVAEIKNIVIYHGRTDWIQGGGGFVHGRQHYQC
jgi:hypothetical protein